MTAPHRTTRRDTRARLLASEGLALLCFRRSSARVAGAGTLLGLLGHAVRAVPHTRAGLASLLHPDDRARGEALIGQAIAGDVLLGRLRAADGSYRRYRQRTMPEAGAAVHAVWRPAEAQDLPRPDGPLAPHALRLVGRASHELRSPLNGILGLLRLVQQIGCEGLQRRYVDLAAQSASHLLRVLDSMLELARLGSAGISAHPGWIDLDGTLTSAVRSITPQLGWRDFSLVYDIDSDTDQLLLDGGMLCQVVVNLVANAARHTVRGFVGVRADTRWTGPTRVMLRLEVQDSGGGIAPERLPQLFDPFALAALARQHGGSGLGLSIVRTLVVALGGRIDVRSRVDEGTMFSVEIECEARRTQHALALAVPKTVWLLYQPPFQEGAAWLSRRIERIGGQALIVPDFDDARARAAAMPAPDLVIVAAHSISGPQDLPGLRECLPDTPMALLTRLDWRRPELEQQALALGAEALPVPLAQADLRRLLGLAATPAFVFDPPPAERPRPLGGRVLVVEDDAVNRLVIEEALRALDLTPSWVARGEDALPACQRQAPDVLLLDLALPGIDGHETARRLRAEQARGTLPWFPIVAHTAETGADAEQACTASGFDAVLVKPCALKTLRELLGAWLAVEA